MLDGMFRLAASSTFAPLGAGALAAAPALPGDLLCGLLSGLRL